MHGRELRDVTRITNYSVVCARWIAGAAIVGIGLLAIAGLGGIPGLALGLVPLLSGLFVCWVANQQPTSVEWDDENLVAKFLFGQKVVSWQKARIYLESDNFDIEGIKTKHLFVRFRFGENVYHRVRVARADYEILSRMIVTAEEKSGQVHYARM